MPKFTDFFSLEQYQSIIDVHLSERKKEKIDYQVIFKEEESFSSSMFNYLTSKVENHELSMPKNSETHTSSFLKNWQNFLDGKIKDTESKFIYRIFKDILRIQTSSIIYGKDNKTVADSYNELTNYVDNGNFEYFDLKIESECSCCGRKMEMQSKNWNLELIEVDYSNYKEVNYTSFPACVEDKLHQVKVEFKTGEILIADWFRIEEFTDKVKYNDDYTDISINFDAGQIKSTQHAANLGFVTIHVGNSCPTIFQNGNNFLFGHMDYDKEECELSLNNYQEHGSVCTDLWNVTIIDKSRLIEIVAESLGEEKAIQTVNDYLKENDVDTFTIQPGQYLIEFNPRNSVNQYDSETPKDIDTFFSMKQIKLQKKLKP